MMFKLRVKNKNKQEDQQNIPTPEIEEPSTPPVETKPTTETPILSPSNPQIKILLIKIYKMIKIKLSMMEMICRGHKTKK